MRDSFRLLVRSLFYLTAIFQLGCSEAIPEFLKIIESSPKEDLVPTPYPVTNIVDGISHDSALSSPKLSWKPPENLNSSTLSHYEIKIEDETGTTFLGWTPIGSDSQFQLLNLPPSHSFQDGVTYFPIIRAVNSKKISGPEARGDGWKVLYYANTAFKPNTYEDSGSPDCTDLTLKKCTLRQVISDANLTGSGSTTVQLEAGTYVLSSGVVPLSGSLTIRGQGPGVTIVDAQASSGIFAINGAPTVKIENLTLKGGISSSGGAIDYSGTAARLTVKNVFFIENKSTSGGGGALHFHSGDVVVENCVFQNNESAGSYGGAAIGKHYDGSLTIVSSKFLNNNASCANCSGGAIEITDGTQTLNVSNSIFADNVAKKYGGAISTGAAATTSLLNNTFLNNTAFNVGGAYNAGGTSSADLESNTFVGNLALTNGGGIFIENTSTEFKNNVFHSNFSAQTASTLEDCYKTGGSLTSVGGNISDGTLCNVTAGPGDTFESTDLYSDSSVSHLADFFSLYLQIFSGSASRGHGLSCSRLDGLNTSRGATCDAGSTQYISTSRPLDIEYKFSKLTLPFTQPAVAIRPFSPVVQGGSATSFSISPSLPAGLDFNLSNGTISGTPVYSLTSPMRFTVTASNTFGSASTILTIDIKEGFFVDTNNDLSDGSIGDGRCQTANNKCSLRAAIEESNTSGSPRLIYLPNGHYSLDSNLPIISFNLTLIGETKLATIIDGKSAHKIFNVGASVSKRDFVFQNLTLKDSVGALSFSGSNVIEIQNVYVQNNVSTGAGAGLFIDGNESNYINIENSRFEGNLSDSGGGALFGNSTYHTLSISKSTFKGNHCQNSSCDGGAIGGFKIKRITHSLFENNSSTDKGGAIFWVGESNGAIINTSFYKNQSKYGGAIYFRTYSTLNISQSSFVKNTHTSSGSGAAIHPGSLTGNLIFHNLLFESNTENGVATIDHCASGSSSIYSQGGNTILVTDPNCQLNHSLDKVIASGTLISNSELQASIHPFYPPLIKLRLGSPAIDAGNNFRCQRKDGGGLYRRNGSTTASLLCDSGADEYFSANSVQIQYPLGTDGP